MGKIKDTVRTDLNCFDANDERLVVVTDPKSKYFDERNLIPPSEELIESILADGIIQNITVRKHEDAYYVISGNKRVMAARIAQERLRENGSDFVIRIPTKPVNVNEYKCLRVKVAENEIRVNDSPYYKGQKAQQMLDMHASHEEIESAFGAKWGTICNWISIYQSGDKVGDAVTNGEITTTQALEVARAPEAEKEKVLQKVRKIGKRKPGKKRGGKKKIVITCYEKDGEGFDLNLKGKCSNVELESIISELDKILAESVDSGELEF